MPQASARRRTTWTLFTIAIAATTGLRSQSCGSGPPTTLGQVTVVSQGNTLPSPLPNTTFDVLRIDCAGLPPIGLALQISEPPAGVPVRGTIVFCSGGAGVVFYSSEQNGIPLFQRLLAHGFRLVDRLWAPGWFMDTMSIRKQSCRFATALQWIHDQYHTTGVFGAFGQSGGAAELGYAMTTWNAPDLLDLAVFSGGPPMCRFDLQCPDPPPAAWLQQCTSLIPAHVFECGQPACVRIRAFNLCDKCGPGATAAELRAQSVLHTNAVTHYPNTRTHLLIGTQDCFDGVPSGMLYYNAVTSEKVLEFVPRSPHLILFTQPGQDAIVRALLAGAASRPGPATLGFRAWPSIGAEAVLDLHGPNNQPWAVISSLGTSLTPIPAFGWLELAVPMFVRGQGTLDATSGRDTLRLPMPPNPALIGLDLYLQGLVGTWLTNRIWMRVVP